MHHFALLYPDQRELAHAEQCLFDHDDPSDEAEDHGGTVSVYLRDADGNGIELYYDRPLEAWFDPQGRTIMKVEAFEPRELLAELGNMAERV